MTGIGDGFILACDRTMLHRGRPIACLDCGVTFIGSAAEVAVCVEGEVLGHLGRCCVDCSTWIRISRETQLSLVGLLTDGPWTGH